MKKRMVVFLAVLGTVCFTGALTRGQMSVPKLTDADVRRVLPVMRADAAERQGALKEMGQTLEKYEKMTQEMAQRMKDLESGKLDPLAYLKQRSPYVSAPPSAAYKPKLSRIASLWAYGYPIAVFSYGIESEAARNLAHGGESAARQYANFGDIYKGPAGQKIKAAEEEFKSFYTAKGFRDLAFTKVPGWSCVSPDGSVSAWFVFVNLYAGTKDVEAIPDGPILELGLAEFFSVGEKPQRMDEPESPAHLDKEQALREAGMSEEEYGAFVNALAMARNDAANPSAIDPANIGLDYDGPMEPEMKKTLVEMRAFYEVRRQNSILYKRHAAVLDPLLTALGQ